MSIDFKITPEMDQRIQAWLGHARKNREEDQNPGRCVTISREFGCQGYPVAQALMKRLNAAGGKKGIWIVLDRKLLEAIAEQSGFKPMDIQHTSRANPLLHSMFSLFMEADSAKPLEVFTFTKKAVRHFAKTGNSIIVGRGGVNLTQDLDNCLHVRLYATLKFRLANCQKTFGVSAGEAREYLDAHQHERDKFLRHFTQQDLREPTQYHLEINKARWNAD